MKRVPEHGVFVQPFFGGGSIFWSKEKGETEVINDINPDLTNALKSLRKAHSVNCDMRPDKARFHRIRKRGPRTLCDFLYLDKRSFGGTRKSFAFAKRCAGVRDCDIKRLKKNLAKYRDRLKGVKIERKDWREVLQPFDSKETFFFVDPPYTDYTKARGCKWDEGCGMNPAEIKKGVLGLKGKVLITESHDPETVKVFCKDKRFKCEGPFTHRGRLSRDPARKVSHLIITKR